MRKGLIRTLRGYKRYLDAKPLSPEVQEVMQQNAQETERYWAGKTNYGPKKAVKNMMGKAAPVEAGVVLVEDGDVFAVDSSSGEEEGEPGSTRLPARSPLPINCGGVRGG